MGDRSQDNRTRAERKRADRTEKRENKLAFGAQGLTRKELSDAEEELDALATQHTASHGVVWTTLVEQWQAVDYQRESARTAYGRIAELKRLGRTADTKALIQTYADSKQELQLVEDQMIAFLADEDFGDEEIRSFLYDQRAVPGKGMRIRPPESLVDILQGRLKSTPDHENTSHDGVAAMSAVEGPEVHGSDP